MNPNPSASGIDTQAGVAALSNDFVPVTLIPRPGQIPDTIKRIEEMFSSVQPTLKSKAESLHSVAIKVARDNLSKRDY